MHVHHHGAAGIVLEHVDGALLDIGVDGQHHFLAGLGGDGTVGILAHHHAGGVDLDPLAAGIAAQLLVIGLFDALLADAEGRIVQQLGVERRRIVRRIFVIQVLLRRLGDIADDVRERAAVIVGAHLVHVGDDARNIGGVEADLGEILPRQVGRNDGRHRPLVLVDVAQDTPPRRLGLRQDVGDLIQRVVDVLDLVGLDQHAEAGPVAGDQLAVAVDDIAARRRHQAKVELVAGGQLAVLAPLQHLQVDQPAGQGEQAERHYAAHDEGAAIERSLTLIDVCKDDGRFGGHGG